MNKYTDKQIRKMILDWLVAENLENDSNPKENENYKGLAESCHYSIIKDYTPDCPGWCGDILTVAFGHLEAVYVFRIDDNRLMPLLSKKTR